MENNMDKDVLHIMEEKHKVYGKMECKFSDRLSL